VDPSLTPKTVHSYIQSRLAHVRVCYELVLEREPTVSGKIVVNWTINVRGLAEGVSIQSDTTNDAELCECIRELVAGWTFPPPQGVPVDVSFPFLFQPSPNSGPATPR
jgi:hypothetical protein